jgi:hypothetical protein
MEGITLDLSGSITLDFSNYDVAQPTYAVSGIDTITIDGSNWTTDWLADREIVDEHHEEKRIRDSHPAVQHAWEQYQIMLNLAREDEKSAEDTQ